MRTTLGADDEPGISYLAPGARLRRISVESEHSTGVFPDELANDSNVELKSDEVAYSGESSTRKPAVRSIRVMPHRCVQGAVGPANVIDQATSFEENIVVAGRCYISSKRTVGISERENYDNQSRLTVEHEEGTKDRSRKRWRGRISHPRVRLKGRC